MYCQTGNCTNCGKKNILTYAIGYNGMFCEECLEVHKKEKGQLWAILCDSGN
jgi:hypothetical protein